MSIAPKRPIEDIGAADEFRATVISRADADNHGSPLWYGWVIVDAFLAGMDHARAAAPPVYRIPDGFRLVPERPTREMISAAVPMYDAMIADSEWPFTINLWRAMLQAAPQPPVVGED